ncbi:MAG: RNA polymerase sigma factor [Solirubrobacterales bacterium]
MLREKDFQRTLSAARAGAEWAWRDLYEELAPVVLGYLRGRAVPDPEDLTGEVFLQVVRDLPRFEGGSRAFRAWTLTITRNRLFDERRREARRPEQPHPDPAGAEIAGDVSEDALARLSLERVTRMLAPLSPDQRDVILLRIVGDLSLDEVARVTGKRRGAVKQLQRRGLAAIRRQLEQERIAR